MFPAVLCALIFAAVNLHAAGDPFIPFTVDAQGKILERVVVQKGDTLWKISTVYGASIEELSRYNGLKEGQIRTHQVILVPLSKNTAGKADDQDGSLLELIRKGDGHRNRREYAKAVECYAAVLEKDPHFFEALLGAGFAKLQLGESDQALRHFINAVRLEPYNSRSHYNLGLVFVSLKNKNGAFEQYRILKSLNGDSATRLLMHIDALK